MTSFLANIDVLTRRFPHVSTRMKQMEQQPPSDGALYTEGYDRDMDWLQAVEGVVGSCKIMFVYGFQRGLSIADLLDLYPDRWLFVYEPDEELFYQSLVEYDLTPILESKNLYAMAVGASQLKLLFHLLCSYMQQELSFVALRSYLQDDQETLQKLRENFDDYRSTYFTNKYTENFFRKEWMRNYLFHLADGLDSPFVEEMVYTLQGATAIIISSGPSLQEDIEWIRKLKEHTIIIAGGSSIQALVKNGIQPHAAVIMDGHPVNNNIFSTSEMLQAPLLFTSSSYYEIAERKGHSRIYGIMKNDLISQYFMGFKQDDVLMTPAATVASNAIQLAAILGAKRILLAGQDLSYPNQKFYTEGIAHFAEETTDTKVRAATLKVLNVNGTYNDTDDGLMFMKEVLENMISNLPDIEFINTTRNGAAITGVPFRPIDELYEEIQQEQVADQVIEDWLQQRGRPFQRERADFVNARLKETQADLLKMRDEIHTIEKLLGKIRELSRTRPAKAQSSIEKVEQLWGQIANREWFAPIFETIIPLEIARFDQNLPLIITETKLTLKSDLIHENLGRVLSKIAEIIPEMDDLMSEAIIRVEKVIEVESSFQEKR